MEVCEGVTGEQSEVPGKLAWTRWQRPSVPHSEVDPFSSVQQRERVGYR